MALIDEAFLIDNTGECENDLTQFHVNYSQHTPTNHIVEITGPKKLLFLQFQGSLGPPSGQRRAVSLELRLPILGGQDRKILLVIMTNV